MSRCSFDTVGKLGNENLLVDVRKRPEDIVFDYGEIFRSHERELFFFGSHGTENVFGGRSVFHHGHGVDGAHEEQRVGVFLHGFQHVFMRIIRMEIAKVFVDAVRFLGV